MFLSYETKMLNNVKEVSEDSHVKHEHGASDGTKTTKADVSDILYITRVSGADLDRMKRMKSYGQIILKKKIIIIW